MDNIDKKEELTDTLFKLIEDIGRTEELIEEVKKETSLIKDTIRQDIELIQEKLEQQSQNATINPKNPNIDSIFEEIKQKINALEKELSALKDSKNKAKTSINIDELSNLNDAMVQKIILKKEISRWQMIIIINLVVFFVFSAGLFIFRHISPPIAIVYVVFSIAFCVALYFINSNLKNLTLQKKGLGIK